VRDCQQFAQQKAALFIRTLLRTIQDDQRAASEIVTALERLDIEPFELGFLEGG
jgi:hypothetical protein